MLTVSTIFLVFSVISYITGGYQICKSIEDDKGSIFFLGLFIVCTGFAFSYISRVM